MNAFLLESAVRLMPFSSYWLIGVDKKNNYLLSISPEEKRQFDLDVGPNPFANNTKQVLSQGGSQRFLISNLSRGDCYLSKEVGYRNFEIIEFIKYTRIATLGENPNIYFIDKYNLTLESYEGV